jgi:hypothetical protein
MAQRERSGPAGEHTPLGLALFLWVSHLEPGPGFQIMFRHGTVGVN